MGNRTKSRHKHCGVLSCFWLLIIKCGNDCLVCVQDFADDLDVMPSITMENNVIHNNEGYGVIVVKPNNGEQDRVPLDRSEGR